MKEENVAAQYGRVKGAEWFPFLYKKDIMVLGQGGIGSWVSLFLARIGADLHIFDMDTFEDHNLTGQATGISGIGMKKVAAVKTLVEEMAPDCRVSTYGEYGPLSPSNTIVVCGFDNMGARKTAFDNWLKSMGHDVIELGANPKDYFFQDGRLLAEQLQIFNIPGDRKDLIEKYAKERLPDDADIPDADCTFKQTTHCAAMIASHMVGFLTNWISNVKGEVPYRQVPFFYEYVIPINMHT